ncbi:MAG: type II toxin-antitoxin system prevent-host-death family antitoxin [Candidatus Omnitrophota bacterium]|jgi:antitoxin (DNA-binding transcriptional repressor) of toxin-antitoxin stability system|nr:MAG: type II toxin-antitoxin system prevent-host-death family antitoxin [Candidatus Omnitrophota bacterium]
MLVDIHEAENNLSKLIDKAHAGEEIIIKKDDIEARLHILRFQTRKEHRKPGAIPDLIIKDNFDDPLPNDIAEAFGKVNLK